MYNSSKHGFTIGATSTYAPTSSYATFATIPATGSYLRFDVTGPTTSLPVDFRLMHSVVSGSSGFDNPTTTFLNLNGSTKAVAVTKRALFFAMQAKQSSATTDAMSIQANWVSLG